MAKQQIIELVLKVISVVLAFLNYMNNRRKKK